MLQYCITCQRMVYVSDFHDVHVATRYIIPDTAEPDLCNGPFASCPPPEQPDIEPVFDMSDDELAMSNQNALELLDEIIGE